MTNMSPIEWSSHVINRIKFASDYGYLTHDPGCDGVLVDSQCKCGLVDPTFVQGLSETLKFPACVGDTTSAKPPGRLAGKAGESTFERQLRQKDRWSHYNDARRMARAGVKWKLLSARARHHTLAFL